MKVSQLIDALQKMDPEAEVLTHADNHTTDRSDSMRVGGAVHVWQGNRWPLVIIGNWDSYNLACWKGTHIHVGDESLAVLNWGDNEGELIRQRHSFRPKTKRQVTRSEDVEERFEMETVK